MVKCEAATTGPLAKWTSAASRSIDGEQFQCTLELFDAEKDRFPYDDGYFSTVLCCELMEHLTEDPMHMMAEINRILAARRASGAHHPEHRLAARDRRDSCRAIIRDFSRRTFGRASEGEEPEARHNREYTPREIGLLFHYAGFEMTLLETGPFRNEPKPEHEWVKHLLDRYEQPADLRGDGIYAVGRKTGRCASGIRRGCINDRGVSQDIPGAGTRLDARRCRSRLRTNRAQTWTPESFSLGWQFFDPQSHRFIRRRRLDAG